MSKRRKPKTSQPLNAVFNAFRSFLQSLNRLIGNVLNGLRRRVFVLGRERPQATAGFVLPTVIMVMLVVTLLTLTIVFRSFDRAKNASNVRISQVALEAASPAVDRATAKLNTLFDDPRLPRSTPSDSALYGLLSSDNRFVFSDEDRLSISYDLNNSGSIDLTSNGQPLQLEKTERVTTAWRFPVDTDGNGKYDSFTIYSVLFRSPERKANGQFSRERQPLDARTPPMNEGVGAGVCEAALTTSAGLVSEGGWFKSGSKLKKSFFVYTATVPITNLNQGDLIPSVDLKTADGTQITDSKIRDKNNYENNPSGRTFAALEYQQDRARIPIANNAVVFEDDLAIVGGTKINLNGSIITNGNLFISPTNNNKDIVLHQVSAPASCFYVAENGKISVGGNIINSPPNEKNQKQVGVHLFIEGKNPDTSPIFDSGKESVNVGTNYPQSLVHNSQAYTDRINHLVEKSLSKTMPEDVQKKIDVAPASEKDRVKIEALTAYFKDRTRRVPFLEVDLGATDTMKDPVGDGNTLRPPTEWMFPVDASNSTQYNKVTLRIASEKAKPEATEPETLASGDKENHIGDRILVGNGLPAKWYKDGEFVGTETDQLLDDNNNVYWDTDTSATKKQRTRSTQIKSLADIGDKSRDGFWELAAATQPENTLDGYGGLRIITGAGVYERKNSFLPPPTPAKPSNPSDPVKKWRHDDPRTSATEEFPVVWPDTMPMSPVAGAKVFNNNPSFDDPSTAINPEPLDAPLRWTELPATLPTAVSGTQIDKNSKQYTKGDLRMRAAAVYHYAQDVYDPDKNDYWQKPIACVATYYDPSDVNTARNKNGLPADVSGDPSNGSRQNDIGSHNGIIYGPPTKTAEGISASGPNAQGLFSGDENSSGDDRLYYQANLVFPNGRFANEPLRDALIALAKNGGQDNRLTLSQQSAIDSTLCALQILDGTLSPTESVTGGTLKHGTIKEVSFLDSRQIKAIHKGTSAKTINGVDLGFDPDATFRALGDSNNSLLTTDYDLPIEHRQPLEVRVTQIDLDKLRKEKITLASPMNSTSPDPEYLLPNSGIVYASRDDALPDLSAPLTGTVPTSTLSETQKAEQRSDSPVDYKLDPTRRPSGIMVSNGLKLSREDKENFRPEEKGLILVSNVPAYVWANQNSTKYSGYSAFNDHTQEEFKTDLNNDWGNFYSRGGSSGDANPNFACRPNDARLPNCSTGDTWRPATIIADSMGLLSGNFRFGFRNEGDFDLRNNQNSLASVEKRLKNGFFDNNYVTNGLSSGGIDGYTSLNDNSYSNFGSSTGSSYFNNFVTPVQRRHNDYYEYLMEVCPKLLVSECGPNDWYVNYDVSNPRNPDNDKRVSDSGVIGADFGSDYLTGDIAKRFNAGTTARPPAPKLQRFARRVAFKRNPGGQIALTPNGSSTPTVVPIGIKSDKITPYPYRGTGSSDTPDKKGNSLWFAGTWDANDPWSYGKWRYDNNKRLAYLNFTPADETEEFILPDVLPASLRNRLTGTEKTVMDTVSNALNGSAETPTATYPYFTGNDDSSDYIFCIGGTDTTGRGRSSDYLFTSKVTNDCPKLGDIKTAREQLIGLAKTGVDIDASTAQTLTADRPVNVYEITAANNILSGKTIELDKGNQDDPIFVFQAKGTKRLTFDNVTLTIKGVNPNNIFWVSDRGVAFDKSNGNNVLAGNFIGETTVNPDLAATPVIPLDEDSNLDLNVGASTSNTTKIVGGRFLGFTGTIYDRSVTPVKTIRSNDLSAIGGVEVTAITGQYQPVLAPVLQIHTAKGTTFDSGDNVNKTNWMQQAKNSIFNVIFAAGNTPPRSGEADGGLANFPRYIENWLPDNSTQNARINGSIMEFDRSKYATAPFLPVLSTGLKAKPFDYPQEYKSGNSGGRIPYTEPPNRLYGFDVGLLSQLPDLFSSRFTAPPAGEPDEFFREVSREDDWVQALLCARTADGDHQAVNADQRPKNYCKKFTTKE
jgi:hypothetical protein